MNFKNLLKPTRNKIILSIVIWLLLPVIKYRDLCADCFGKISCSTEKITIPIIYLIKIIKTNCLTIIGRGLTLTNIVLIIIGMGISYLIASFILKKINKNN